MTSRWEQLSQELYAKAPRGPRHPLLDQLKVEPLSQSPQERVLQDSGPDWSFWDICLPQAENLGPDFLKQAEAAVYLNGDNLVASSQWPRLYCAPTASLTPWKRQLLKERRSAEFNLGLDPFSLHLWQSKLLKADYQWAELAESHPNRSFRLSGAPYVMSGASETQQLAVLMASTVQLMEEAEGFLSARELMSLLSFEVSLESNLMISVAQLRAFRRLMARLQEIYGLAPQSLPVFVFPNLRGWSRREPWNNLLRQNLVNVAARLGCASGVVALPDDLFSGGLGARVSRNVDFVLGKEAHLSQVIDPMAGSYTAEQLTEALCQEVWTLFQEIQAKGGLLQCLRSGWFQAQIVENQVEQEKRFRSGGSGLIGVNQQVITQSLDPQRPLPSADQVIDLETWWMGWQGSEETSEAISQVQRLPLQLLAEPFERWQWAADLWRKRDAGLAQVRFLIEPGLDVSKRLNTAKKVLSALGLEGSAKNQRSPVCVVFAADPQGPFVDAALADLKNEGRVKLILWAGEKSFPGFSGYLGEGVELNSLFNAIEAALVEVSR